VPINVELKEKALIHIINDSKLKGLILDHEFLTSIRSIQKDVSFDHLTLSSGTFDGNLKDQFKLSHINQHVNHLEWDTYWTYERVERSKPAVIMYTSGTTGLPKGVVYTYENKMIKGASFASQILYNSKDRLYCYLPLFHGNALFQTLISSLSMGIPMIIVKKFSASGFWKDIKEHGITSFNALGAIIPILMKQPPNDDLNNQVRMVISSACPADLWERFEKRFGLRLYEAYGAVDAPGYSIANLGDAPVGSFGKPSFLVSAKVVDDYGNKCPDNTPGELVFKLKKKDKVNFLNNSKASSSKNRNGLLHTGDIVYKDVKGYYYFVGRKTESMRVKGENVSAYEVEQVLLEHPEILECAAYAVPSDLAEDEIMVAIKKVDKSSLSEVDLYNWTTNKMAKYQRPRFIRFVDFLPKTSTHRVLKKELEQIGVTTDAFDCTKMNMVI
jgi:crotonobetaine/carnitine-CoA ligase